MKNNYVSGDWNAVCNKCNTEKPLSAFYLHSNGKPRKQCKECHYARGSAWKGCNRESVNTAARECSPEQREARRARSQQWRKENLSYDAFRARTYRARKLQAVPVWANLDEIKTIYEKCPKGFHVDHVIPLKGKTVCGLHVEHNLQYLPALDNIRKRNKYEEFV
jgi:hypothetical protein